MNRYYVLRAEHGLTQEELAERAGISRGTVTRLENHSDPKPTAEVAKRLADFYGMSVTELLTKEAA